MLQPKEAWDFMRNAYLAMVLGGLGLASAASAEGIKIHLPRTATVSRTTVRYRCDAQAAKTGLPAGSFRVDYINGGGNSLAVVPINGSPLVFSSVMSGSGARYAAEQFIWWDAKGVVSVSADTLNGNVGSACKPIPLK
jgi:membrane-bound inhibitor of C-type lysozyme